MHQVNFTRIFGEPAINHNARRFGISGSPEIYRISNIKKNGKAIGTAKAGTEWHSDMCYAQKLGQLYIRVESSDPKWICWVIHHSQTQRLGCCPNV